MSSGGGGTPEKQKRTQKENEDAIPIKETTKITRNLATEAEKIAQRD